MVIVSKGRLNENGIQGITWSEFCTILRGYGNKASLQIEFIDGSSVSYLVLKGKFEYHFMGNQLISFKGNESIYRLKQESVNTVEQVQNQPIFYIFMKNKITCKISVLV